VVDDTGGVLLLLHLRGSVLTCRVIPHRRSCPSWPAARTVHPINHSLEPSSLTHRPLALPALPALLGIGRPRLHSMELASPGPASGWARHITMIR
jgi:hypothetical protein